MTDPHADGHVTDDLESHGHAVVCGAGVAGLAAAVDLAQHGWTVTLVESRKHPAESGDTAHAHQPRRIITRACNALLDLCERLGVSEQLKWHDALTFAGPDHPRHTHALKADDLPAPVHLLRPLLKFSLLTKRQRFTVARGLLGVMQAGATPRARQHHNDESFANWLATHGQDGDVIERFWSPLLVSACHDTPDRVAAGHAFQYFQEALLATPDGYFAALSPCPMTTLLQPAIDLIEHAGGHVLLNTNVSSIRVEHGKAVGVTLDTGKTLDADAVVAALPVEQLARLVPDDLAAADPRFAPLDGALATHTFVGIDLYVKRDDDRRIFPASHVLLPGRPVHAIFDHGTETLPDHQDLGPVRRLYALLAPHHDHHDPRITDDEAADLALHELRRINGLTEDHADAESSKLKIVQHRVTKTTRTTFTLAPGVDAERPTTTGETQNLYLAGDATTADWPATMEGAARSGVAAATAVRYGKSHKHARAGTLLYRVLAG